MRDDLNEVKVANSKLSSDRSTEKLLEVKKKFEQMPTTSWKDYSNPGPIENNIYTPSKYLKWEDLEFTRDWKVMTVKMGDTVYKILYRYCYAVEEVQLLSEDKKLLYFRLIGKYKANIQLFNDLHLERVE